MKNCVSCLIAMFFLLGGLAACDGGSSRTSPQEPDQIPPTDTYFSLAITENSHNHTGARLLFLDFQGTTPNPAVIQNNVVISPRVTPGTTINLDGDSSDWDASLLTTVNGLVQNNYPLSEFVDALPRDITVGSAWDEDYIYFIVQWQDAGFTNSTQYKKWILGDQGDGESGWNPKIHIGTTSGAPNELAANATGHTLLGKENEDRVLMMFPIVDSENNFSDGNLGCAAYCHTNLKQGSPYQNYTGLGLVAMHTNVQGDTADIWHWKSSRTAPSGYADDKYLAYTVGSDSGRTYDFGASIYSSNGLFESNPAFMHSSDFTYSGDALYAADAAPYTTDFTGDQLPAVISTNPTGSRGDVETRSSFSGYPDYRWTVEYRRLRNTGNNDDHQFNAGTDAVGPSSIAVVAGDDVEGAKLYVAAKCVDCHDPNGSGSASSSTWDFPRIQRASGSLIHKALRTVWAMQDINLTDQQIEDIAAYLQTQDTFDETWRLSISVPPAITKTGIVNSLPHGISCPGDCEFDFVRSGIISLSASYVHDYTFDSWSGGGEGCVGNRNCDVFMDASKTVSANYSDNPDNYKTLTILNAGGGTVNSSTDDIACAGDCTKILTADNPVTLTAIPAPGYQFDDWTGGVCNGSTNSICEFVIDADYTITAKFSTLDCGVGVIYDVNGSNGIGRQQAINTGSVSYPTDMAFIPGTSAAFLVTAQSGTVHYFNDGCTAVNSIDLKNNVIDTINNSIAIVSGGEQGLLNVEFHPDYANNKYVFFYHTSVGSTVNSVSRMTVSYDQGNLVLADPVKIIDFRKPNNASNHNGGGLVFAPDGTLLASVGDGGGGNSGNAQLGTSLLGSVIRVSPSPDFGVGGYTIPDGNMFSKGNAQCTDVAQSGTDCPEILAMGLRNPYRMSMDGDIVYIGDVGSSYEELNSFDYNNITINFGWPDYDGPIKVNKDSTIQPRIPLLAYLRDDATAIQFRSEDPDCVAEVDPGCNGSNASVMIGDVYRGARYDGLLTGKLLHAEFMDGYMRGMGVDTSGNPTDEGMHIIHHNGISAMIEGSDGYIYIVTQRAYTSDANMVYRLVKPQ